MWGGAGVHSTPRSDPGAVHCFLSLPQIQCPTPPLSLSYLPTVGFQTDMREQEGMKVKPQKKGGWREAIRETDVGSVSHFSPKYKEVGLGLSEIGDETLGTQGKGWQGTMLFPVVQGRLSGCVSHIPLGPVSPLLDTRLQSLYCVLGAPRTREGGAHAPKGDTLALQK